MRLPTQAEALSISGDNDASCAFPGAWNTWTSTLDPQDAAETALVNFDGSSSYKVTVNWPGAVLCAAGSSAAPAPVPVPPAPPTPSPPPTNPGGGNTDPGVSAIPGFGAGSVPAGPNLAFKKLASSSGDENSTVLPPAAAFDGDFTTRWSSAFADAEWLEVDLGTVQPVGQVVLRWERATGRSARSSRSAWSRAVPGPSLTSGFVTAARSQGPHRQAEAAHPHLRASLCVARRTALVRVTSSRSGRPNSSTCVVLM